MKNIGHKENFCPKQKISNGKKLIMWDLKPYNGMYSWEEKVFPGNVSFEEIKEYIIGYYDKITKSKIENNFVWKGIDVRLTIEAQNNYKNLYDCSIRSLGKNLPIELRLGSKNNPIYYKIETLDELEEFYFSYVDYIQKCVHEGWEIKDGINWKEYV